MNKKKSNIKHLHHPFHISFLTLFPILLLIAILLTALSIWKATNDQKRIAQYLRNQMYDTGPREGLIFYKVQKEDTLEGIAETFDVSVDSIVWANDIPDEGISANMVLSIPPVSGVMHEVQQGESTDTIALLYKADPDNIRNFPFNEFMDEDNNVPVVGQLLVVPGGRLEKDEDNVLGEFFRRFFN